MPEMIKHVGEAIGQIIKREDSPLLEGNSPGKRVQWGMGMFKAFKKGREGNWVLRRGRPGRHGLVRLVISWGQSKAKGGEGMYAQKTPPSRKTKTQVPTPA